MKKRILVYLILCVGMLFKANAQCSVQTLLNEDFSNPTDQVGGGGLRMPTCWKSITAGSGSNFHAINGVLNTHQANVTNSRYAITPEVVFGNGVGYLSFDAQGLSGQTKLEIGAVTSNTSVASYTLIQEVTITSTKTRYSVDLSSYTGAGTYLVFRDHATAAFQGVTIDNVVFTPTVPEDISICEGESYSIGDSTYTEQNVYVSIVKDQNGGDSTVSTNLTVNPKPTVKAAATKKGICQGDSVLVSATGADTYSWDGGITPNQYFVPTATKTYVVTGTSTATNCSAKDSVKVELSLSSNTIVLGADTVCSGSTHTITVDNTITGVSYQLRNDADDQAIGALQTGNGSTVSFTTNAINSISDFNILATHPEGDLTASGLSFDGSATADVPTTLTNTATNKFTIESWVNLPASSNENNILTNAPTTSFSSALGLIILQVRNGAIRFFMGLNGSTSWTNVIANNVVPLDSWTHIAATFDGTSLKIYVNGQEVGSKTIPANTIGSSNNMFSIGRNYKGNIDEVRVWNVARTEQEIQNSMNNCLVGNESGLNAYYRLEEGQGTVVKDLVNGEDGTITNSAVTWSSGTPLTCKASCSTELSTKIKVSPVSLDNTVTANGNILSVYNNALAPQNISYKWLDCNNSNQTINGETTKDFSPSASGNYACEMKVGTCVSTTSCTPVTVTGLFSSTSTTNNVSLHPNPAKNYMIIDTQKEISKVTVSDMKGNSYSLELDANNGIDISQLTSGMYIMHIYTNNEVLTGQIIKE